MMRSTSLPLRSRRGQSGSAYLIALMAMVVLAILGLSLSFVTQTEMLIGTAERNIQRAHYLAESGLQIAIARLLIDGQKDGAIFTFQDEVVYAGEALAMRAVIAPVFPIANPPCNLCQVNRQSQYPEDSYYNVRHVFTIKASMGRVDANFDLQEVVAERNLHALIEIQPWKDAAPPHVPPESRVLVNLAAVSDSNASAENP